MAGFTAVAVTGTWDLPPGAGVAVGEVRFTLTQRMVNTTTGEVVEPSTKAAQLDATGSIPAGFTLYANDDTTTSPGGSRYFVTVDILGVPFHSSYVTIPHTATGGTIALAGLLSTP